MRSNTQSLMSGRLPAVEGLRAFAAISVLWMHCILLGPWDFPRGLGAWFHHGWLGVDLFLVISGFATTHALIQGLNSAQTQPLRNYWRNRVARICPLYFLTSVVYLGLIDASPVLGSERFLQIASHLTLIHGWFPQASGAINGVTWTLTLEMELYVCGFLLMLTPFGRSQRFRSWIAVAIFVFSIAILYRLTIFLLNVNNLPMLLHWISQLPGLWEGFFLGVLIAKHDEWRTASASGVTSLDRRRTTWIFAAGLIASIALVFLLERLNAYYWQSWPFPTLYRSAVAVAFGLLVWAAVRFDREGGWVPGTGTNEKRGARRWQPLAARLGAWSYGIYLWQVPVLLLLKRTEAKGGLLFLLTFGCTLVLAASSYRWFELPLMQWSRRRAR
jgi:peptidoglycan/LPS O-acetylase OafA/YrhL